MAFWDDLTIDKIGDGFDTLLGAYLEREQIKASSGTQAAVTDQAQLIGMPASITENTNAMPATPEAVKTTQIVAAGDSVNIAGVMVPKTALYVGAAVVAALLIAKF